MCLVLETFFKPGVCLISLNCFLKSVYVFMFECLYIYLFVFMQPREQTINWWKQPIYEK